MKDEWDTEAAVAAFAEKAERRLRTGRLIVRVVAVVQLLGTFAQAFVEFQPLAFLLGIALAAALFFGVSWVCYLFAVCSALDVVWMLYLLCGGATFSGSPFAALVIGCLLLRIVYDIAVSVLLFCSKAVKDFLYAQKNG